ncbi:tRNA pseudouridine(13) synthase TruD [Agaribacter flavus]|uniref:tRNA pseudouridine synthase D n=1 Tax=Agaribacter flavus TaxID=1902781 RepID=A0ABV7FYG4_9ALTE
MTRDIQSHLSTEQWAYLHGKPALTGTLKQTPQDFVVKEVLGFTPTNSGEHSFLWIKKTNLNTAYVAELLAKFCQVPLRNIGYAGRKDKRAETYQWFSVYHASRPKPDWNKFKQEDMEIVNRTFHDKKLKTGSLRGNTFSINIQLHQAPCETWLDERMKAISEQGVPNYFGQQRFGEMQTREGNMVLNGNLRLGERLLAGEAIKNRNKRSMVISALRSWLFNQMLSERIERGLFDCLLVGDVLQLSGSKSYFVCTKDEFSRNNQRRVDRDVQLTASLWGQGKPLSRDDALVFESSVVNEYRILGDKLTELGLKQERRATVLYVKDLDYQVDSDILKLKFELPSGAFATSVIREIVST